VVLDISSLTSSLGPWEFAGYLATAVVIAGCIGESIVEFTTWIKDQSLKSVVGRASAFILIVGLALEIPTQVRINAISGQIIALLNNQTAEAKLETKRIEATVAWRIIPNDKYIAMAHVLATGHGSVTIGWIVGDTESMYFAWQLAAMFAEVNGHVPNAWIVQLDPRLYSNSIVWSLAIPDCSNAACETIRKAFKEGNVQFSTENPPPDVVRIGAIETTNSPPTTDAFIMVGSKPPPPISFSVLSANPPER